MIKAKLIYYKNGHDTCSFIYENNLVCFIHFIIHNEIAAILFSNVSL